MTINFFFFFAALTVSFLNLAYLAGKKTDTKYFYLTFFINLSFLSTLSFFTKEYIFKKDQDTWMHLAIIKQNIENGLFSGDPFYKGLFTPPHYSLVDLLFSYISNLTGLDAHILWGTASPFLLIFISISLYLWIQELSSDKQVAMLGSLIGACCLYKSWPYIVIPKHTALIFYFMTHYFFIRAWRSGKRLDIIIAGISYALCITVHLFTGIMVILSIAGFLVFYILLVKFKWEKTYKSLYFIPGGIVLASPWILNTLLQSTNVTEKSLSHFSLPEIETIYSIFDRNITILNPVFFLNIVLPVIWIFALIALVVCLKNIKNKEKSEFNIFLISGTAMPFIILLTPLYTIFKNHFGVWMPPRLLIVMPLPILAAYGIIWMINRNFILYNHKIALNFTLPIVLMTFFSPILKHQSRLYNDPERLKNRTIPIQLKKELGTYSNIMKNKVVLSDPWTSYLLPYFTGAYTIVMPPANGSPFINHEKRIKEILELVNGTADTKDIEQILEKYNPNFILLNMNIYSGVHGNDSQMLGFQIAKKIEMIQNIDLIEQTSKYILFRRIKKNKS